MTRAYIISAEASACHVLKENTMMTNSFCISVPFPKERAVDSMGMIRTAGLMAANAALLTVITPFALLREDPMFWRNAGGWPILLRRVVLYTFYPLLGSEVLVLLALSALVFCSPALARLRKHTWTFTGFLWLWIAMITVFIASNNVANLLAGRPLHWHPS